MRASVPMPSDGSNPLALGQALAANLGALTNAVVYLPGDVAAGSLPADWAKMPLGAQDLQDANRLRVEFRVGVQAPSTLPAALGNSTWTFLGYA